MVMPNTNPRCCGVHAYVSCGTRTRSLSAIVLIALLQKAQSRTQSRPHKPGWLNGRSESLSLSQAETQSEVAELAEPPK